MSAAPSYFIVGGAGFIGSHFCDHLLADERVERVTAYDSFVNGKRWHVEHLTGDTRFQVVEGDVVDEQRLLEAMRGHEVVIHLASNPDIARAVTEPAIDFTAGTLLTHYVLEAARLASVRRLIYASGSGIYGELGELELDEDFGPLVPISTYAASKIAGEALVSAYCAMFDLQAYVFRFGNVVGKRQTHGVGYDFVRRLREDPTELRILGDGEQSKPYVHVSDVVEAVLLASEQTTGPYAVYNVATGDYATVNEIARIALGVMGLDESTTKLVHTGGDRGWKGDVPVVRLNTDRIRALGWKNRLSSLEALASSIKDMAADDRHVLR